VGEIGKRKNNDAPSQETGGGGPLRKMRNRGAVTARTKRSRGGPMHCERKKKKLGMKNAKFLSWPKTVDNLRRACPGERERKSGDRQKRKWLALDKKKRYHNKRESGDRRSKTRRRVLVWPVNMCKSGINAFLNAERKLRPL